METETTKTVKFRFICSHLHAGNVFVLGKVDDDGPVVLLSKPLKETTKEAMEVIGKQLAEQYGCSYGCNDPWELNGPETVNPEGYASDTN